MKNLDKLSNDAQRLRAVVYEELSQIQRDTMDCLLDSVYYTGVVEGLADAVRTTREAMARQPEGMGR